MGLTGLGDGCVQCHQNNEKLIRISELLCLATSAKYRGVGMEWKPARDQICVQQFLELHKPSQVSWTFPWHCSHANEP